VLSLQHDRRRRERKLRPTLILNVDHYVKFLPKFEGIGIINFQIDETGNDEYLKWYSSDYFRLISKILELMSKPTCQVAAASKILNAKYCDNCMY
jgi:hypothetical protein